MSETESQAVAKVQPVQTPLKLEHLSLGQIQFIGKNMAQSGMFSDARDASQAMTKIIAGQEIGVTPFQAMTNIHIIQGKATMAANLMAAKIKGSVKYDYKVLKMEPEECVIEFFELPIDGKPISLGKSSFTKAEAQKAGTKNMDKFPRNMLFARAMSNGTKWYCPDIFNGNIIYTPEEMGANVNEDGNVIDLQSVASSPSIPANTEPAHTPADAPAEEPEAIEPPKPEPGKTAIDLIREHLEERGFADPNDRKIITLNAANVKTVSELDNNQWLEVLDNLKQSDDETLASLLPKPEPAPKTETAPVTDDDLDNIGKEQEPEADPAPAKQPFEVNKYKKGSTQMVRPQMHTDAKKLYEYLGLTTKVQRENFNVMLGFKKVVSDFDTFIDLLGKLVIEANKKATSDSTEGGAK